MPALREQLSNLTDPDADAAAQTRETLLSELTIPADWTVTETAVESIQEGAEDWRLVTFQHGSDPEKRASVVLLDGSHTLQVFIESAETDEWSEPTRNSTDITAILHDYS